ncbi:MAG: hypothetical protein JXQ85_05185 [Cognatishimia sp.]|uniref:YIP1 family protein n=1 Tax=Cognatishimia sp. TaxID=2211648 RepID=UPI003B8AC62F
MWKQLFIDTIKAPKQAARQVLALELDGPTIWQGLALATILNAVVFVVTILAFPPAAPPMVLTISPVTLAVMFFTSMSIGTISLFWGGRIVGGIASFNDLLALVTWLQYMRLAVQLGGFVLMIAAPSVALLLTSLALLYGVWILLNFIYEAQGFDSFGKAMANLLLGFVGLVFIFSILISFLGFGPTGTP